MSRSPLALLRIAWLLFALPAGMSTAGPALPDESDLAACDRRLASYLDAALGDDPVQAAQHWRADDRLAATRLGVRYRGPALKVDGDSPIWPHRGALRQGAMNWARMPPVVVASGPLAGVVRQDLVLTQGADTLRFPYYFHERDDQWWLASPVALLCATGPAATARFVTCHDRRTGAVAALPEFAVALLDSCIAEQAARLEFDAAQWRRLEAGKLGYLLADPAEVERLAGAPTVGVANLQQDLVVTSHPCHAHELAHLVANFWLGELPPCTLPLLQEGLAVHLGGRWGRHPRVLERLGRTALSEGWVTLDELLMRDGFLRLPADLTYAPAGVFAGFLLRTYGPTALRSAWLAVSGEAAEVSAWRNEEIRDRLAHALDIRWEELAAAFAAFVQTPVSSGAEPGITPAPAAAEPRISGGHQGLVVWDEPGSGMVEIEIEAGDTTAAGALIFGERTMDPARPDEAVTADDLFAAHFPDHKGRGATHALIYTPDEVKLYDYRQQMLVALHAEGFWPSATYARSDGRRLRFRVDRTLWPAGPWTMVESIAGRKDTR